MDSVAKASFGLSETLRIVIPGYYLLVAIASYLVTLFPSLRSTALPDSVFILAGLALGFILYSVNYPNRRAEYKKKLPSTGLIAQAKGLGKPLGDTEHIRLYFYILNNFFPQTFHEVVMVRGALYYCVTYFWACSGIFALIGLVTFAFVGIGRLAYGARTFSIGTVHVATDDRTVWAALLFTVVHALIWYFLTHPNRTDRMFWVICDDQKEWLGVNRPLVEYLIRYRTDPRVLEILKSARGAKT